MGILKIQAFGAGPAKSGISMTQGEVRGKTFFRIGLTAACQTELFGIRLDPTKDAIALIVTNDKDVRHLMGIKIVPADDPAGLPFSGGPHGSASLKLAAWQSNGGGKRPAVSLVIANRAVNGGGISVKLPDWARPDADLSGIARRG